MRQPAKDLPGLKPLDVDRIEQELRIPARQQERSEAGTEKAECDANLANDLVAHLGQESQNALKLVRARLLYHQEQASKACAGLDFEKQKHEIEALQSEIRVTFERDRDDLSYTYNQYIQSKQHFDEYRAVRRLTAPSKTADTIFNIGPILIIIIVAEAFFNAIFLAPVDPQGYLWGAFTAIILAVVGVIIGFGTGFGTKYINSRFVINKTIGVAIAFFGGAFLVIFHYFIMKYRSEMSLFGEQLEAGAEYIGLSELLGRTIISIIQSPLLVNDFNSLIIGVIGIILSFLALMKGYSIGDRYPGYTSQRRQFDNVREQYVNERNKHLGELETLRQEAIDGIRNFIEDAEAGRKLAASYASSSVELLQSYRTFEQSIHSAAQHIVTRYVSDMPSREKSKVRSLVEARLKPAIYHSDELSNLVEQIRDVAQAGNEDALKARERADDLRSRTIAAIDEQISVFRERFADAT